MDKKIRSVGSYFTHFKYPFFTGLRLMVSSVFFIIHAFFPFIPIPKRYNCHDTIHALIRCARW